MDYSLLITLEYPPDKGGVASYYKGIVSHWKDGELQVLKVSLGHFWPRWLPALWEVNSQLTTHNSQLLQVGQILPLGYIALILKWTRGIPYLVYTHGMDILVPQKSWRKKMMLKMILRNAKLIVANSNFTKGELLKFGISEKKIIVVYPCPSVSSEFGVSSSEKKTKTPNTQHPTPNTQLRDKRILLTVSRLVKRKGIDTVIKALPEVLKAIPNLQYVIIGDGPELSNYKLQTTNYKLDDKVLFTGEVSDEEIAAWYDRADVFILTPRQINGDVEGFGTVYLEANSYGVPVIGSQTGGVGEAVIHGLNGLLIAPDSIDQAAQSIISLLTDKQLASTLGEKGRKRVADEFRWEKQISKLIARISN